jgi:mono/diheme cytochrome c family protein
MIKKLLKWTGITILSIVVLITVAVLFLRNRKFDAPYPDIHASKDSAVIAKGKYLVMGAAHCADCHGAVGTEARVDAGEEVPLTGGKVFVIPPGKIYPRNITPDPTGIGNLKDEEIARSLRYGVGTDGRAIFDFMAFHNTSDEDMTAIISYLRSQKPVKNEVPQNEYTVMGNILKAFVIKPAGPSVEIPKSVPVDTTVAYGKYLAFSVANCRGCHTNRDLKTGAFVGKEYAGGFEMESITDPTNYVVYTPNLTPDPKTGRLHGWTEEMFIKRFREGKKIPHSPMPWGPFSRMNEGDLKAIYRYLQTIKPEENLIENILVKKS